MAPNEKIPKKIHYCWFGRNPLPESAKKCIDSWRKFLPDYEIIEWNEDNFDVNTILYTRQAYEAKKYAFVSDYARFKILYDHGGLYFDTDVEVIRPMSEVLSRGPFMGVEVGPCDSKLYRMSQVSYVAPGLGLGAYAGMMVYKQILDYYQELSFISEDGSLLTTTVGEHITSILSSHGYEPNPKIQIVEGINIYPPDWFNPLDDATGRLRITDHTVCIHWYTKSWLPNQSKFRKILARIYHRLIGV